MDPIGTAIFEARRAQRLTQGQLAERAGVSRPLVNRIELGHPTAEIGKVINILTALGLQLTVTDPTAEPASTPAAPTTFATEQDYLDNLFQGPTP